MTQILVTIKESSLSANLMQTIGKLEGVVHTSLYVPDSGKKSVPKTARIRRLRGAAKGITPQQMTDDDRLNYLLSK